MSNVVKTIFTVDASQAFATADAVEARYARVEAKTQKAVAGTSAPGTVTRAGQLAPATVASRKAAEEAKAEAEAIERATAAKIANGAAAAGMLIGLGALAAGFVALGVASKSYEVFLDSRERARRLNAEILGLGVSFKVANEGAREFAETSIFKLNEAQKVYASILNTIDGTDIAVKTLTSSLSAIGDKRNLNADQLVEGIKAIGEGQASVELFGKNANAILDIYAANLGRTADSLTNSERKQALFNQALKEGALAGGLNNERLSDAEGGLKRITVATEGLLAKLGEGASPAVIHLLEMLTVAVGGNPSGGFNANTGFWANLNNTIFNSGQQLDIGSLYAEAQLKQAALDKKRFEEIKKNFQANAQILKDIATDPNKNLTTFSLSKFGDLSASGFGSSNPEVQERAKREAIEEGKKYVDAFKKGISDAASRGDITELRNYRKSFQEVYKNLVSFDDYKSISKQLDDAIRIPIEQGIAKAKELTKQFREVFEGLQRTAGASNPFVILFLDADKAMKTLRENTKGLSADVVKSFEEMQRTQNGLKLFETRLDNSLAADRLRGEAANIRNSTPFFSTDSRIQRLDTQHAQEYRFGSEGRNVKEIELYYEREARRIKSLEGEGVRERLDSQLRTVMAAGAATPEQKAIADRKIIALTSSLKPEDLTGIQREQAALAREREAVRLENAEKDAAKTAKDALKTQQRIDANLKRLVDKANTGGVEAINSELIIRDETNGAVEINKQPKRPTPNDTASLYQNGFGLGEVAEPNVE